MKNGTITVDRKILEKIARDVERLHEELEILINPDWKKAIDEALEEVEKGNIIDREELERNWKEEHV